MRHLIVMYSFHVFEFFETLILEAWAHNSMGTDITCLGLIQALI